MDGYSTGGMVLQLGGGITFGMILTYFGLTAEGLMILTVFLGIDVLFGLLDSYIVTKNTSSYKLIEGLARKFTRRALPFIFIAALRGVGYDGIETLSNIVMSILIISEGYSILGHIYSINYGKSLPEIDALKALMEKVAELFRGELSKKTNEKKEQDK